MNIPEGACFAEMPRRFGFGRIVPRASFASFVREHYVTVRAFGLRYFVAWAKYGGKRVAFRHWLQRDP